MRTRPAFGRCDCAGSDRGWEVAGGYTSEASHVRRSPTPDGNSLLGGVAQLCHAFFHCSPTPELSSHPDELCLRVACDPAGRKCETKGVVVVAALRDRAGDLRFLSRYSNCPLSSHAEEYVVRDEELVRAVMEMAPEDDARSSTKTLARRARSRCASACSRATEARQPRTALELLGRARRQPPPRAARAPGGVAARGGELHVQGALGRGGSNPSASEGGGVRRWRRLERAYGSSPPQRGTG